MTLSEQLWSVAFCTFLLGGAWSFRSNGAWPAVAVMGAGTLLDALVAFLPRLGVESLGYHLQRTNGILLVSMAAGILVYGFFLLGLWFRWRGRLQNFHWCIALAQPLWFLSFIGFLYGLYIAPDAVMR